VVDVGTCGLTVRPHQALVVRRPPPFRKWLPEGTLLEDRVRTIVGSTGLDESTGALDGSYT